MRTARVSSTAARTVATCGAAVLVVALGAVACSDQTTAPGPELRSTVELASVRTLSREQQQRIDEATEAMRWVGEAHDEAMRVVRRHVEAARPGRGRAAKLNANQKCRILEEASDVALGAVDRANRRNRSRAERSALVRGTPEFARCAREFSIFNGAALTLSTDADAALAEAEITGAYEPYALQMYNAVVASGGSIAGVAAAVNGVMQQAAAANIPTPDLQALAAIGSLANASAVEWNHYDWSAIGGGNGDGCTLQANCGDFAMSVSSAAGDVGRTIAKVVVADVGGCLSTVQSWGALRLLLRLAVPSALAAECGFRGAAASAATLIAMI